MKIKYIGFSTLSLIGMLGVFSSVAAQEIVVQSQDGSETLCSFAPIGSVDIDPVSGDLTISVDESNPPECFGSGGTIDVTLSVDPTEITSGDTVTVTWQVTAGYVSGVTDCTATGGTAGWISDVDDSVADDSIAAGQQGTYTLTSSTTFGLSCQNSGGSAPPVAVTVEGSTGSGDGFPDPPPECGGVPSGRHIPFDIVKDFTSNPPDGKPKVNYEEVWGVWPGSFDNADVFIPANQYVALPFNANLAPGKVWQIQWAESAISAPATQVTISRCPGDFGGVGYTDSLCKVDSGATGGTMVTIIGSDPLACDLNQGGIYYLNVRHTTANGSNSCTRSTCSFFAQPRVLN
ncbi:MAG: hypothetical protein QNJ40_14110 [Xanthomonadales bacterium]|nr:hypothetical protein [Xanthomonadales bacterium]